MKTIIKYANRKLYDKEEHKYVSIKELVKLPLDTFRVIRYGLTAEDVTLDTLLSSLIADGIETDSKIRVMQHCILKLNNEQANTIAVPVGGALVTVSVAPAQTLNSTGFRVHAAGAGPLPEILEEDDLFN